MQSLFPIPPEMREMAEKSVEQTKKAFDGFFEAAAKSTTDSQSAFGENSAKLVAYAKSNIDAGLDYAKRLSMARSPEEIWAIQNEFVRSQTVSLTQQANEAAAEVKKAMKPK